MDAVAGTQRNIPDGFYFEVASYRFKVPSFRPLILLQFRRR